jgi:UDP-2,3-diacylglucosamine pyrophosphatase LpxH
MDRADIHREFLTLLLGLRDDRKIRQVRIVARLYNDELLGGDSTATTYVFLPDLHLVSAAAERRYRYGFRKLTPQRVIPRDALLSEFGQRLLAMRDAVAERSRLVTVVLGDLIAVWREQNQPNEDVTSMVRRILDDFSDIQNFLLKMGAGSLRARLLLGNHELWNQTGVINSITLARARKGHLLTVGNATSVVATHGHIFDGLEEMLDDRVQEFFVERFGPRVSGKTRKLDRRADRERAAANSNPRGDPPQVLRNLAEAELLSDWVNVWATNQLARPADRKRSHRFLPGVLDLADGLRQGRQPALDKLDLGDEGPLPDLRTMVIGHTHHARISVHRDTQSPDRDLVLLDCGAWIESCRFTGERAPVPSCQIGILCGGDARIYQLDPIPPR